MTEPITVRISVGELSGTREGRVDRYVGIPYAAPPIGEHRFAEPVPAPAWEGVRDATRTGPTAPQNPMSPQSQTVLANPIDPGDDYLNLNVFAPTGAERAPVMLFIHGGSAKYGSNSLDGYDGSAFARDGVVIVVINYRLGPEGFSVLDGAPANLGYADAIAALRWVRDEIRAFGGDPGNVTIFGESAGGIAVGCLLVSPVARGLFHRAIIQSGMPAARPREKAGEVTRREAKALGVPATRDGFLGIPVDRLLAADAEVTEGGSPLNAKPSYSGLVGDAIIPIDPEAAARDGVADGIPLLFGGTSEEQNLFVAGGAPKVGGPLFALIRARFGVTGRVLRAYEARYPGRPRGYLLSAMIIDLIMRIPMHRIADARARRGAPTWAYEFAWRSPNHDLGAAHAMELPFVFDRLASPDWILLGGDTMPQRIADEMHAAWVRFATTGDPGWRPWDATRPTMVFGDTSGVVEGQRDEELRAWGKRDGDR
jgi:para-nitrobenzyl esterase